LRSDQQVSVWWHARFGCANSGPSRNASNDLPSRPHWRLRQIAAFQAVPCDTIPMPAWNHKIPLFSMSIADCRNCSNISGNRFLWQLEDIVWQSFRMWTDQITGKENWILTMNDLIIFQTSYWSEDRKSRTTKTCLCWCVIRCINGCLIVWVNLDWSLSVWDQKLSRNCTSPMTGSNSDRHIHIWDRFWESLELLYSDLKFSLSCLPMSSKTPHFDSSFCRDHTTW
jgi:hypothetical protein